MRPHTLQLPVPHASAEFDLLMRHRQSWPPGSYPSCPANSRRHAEQMSTAKALLTATAATSVVPTLRYRDVPAAVEWLCAAFGFEKHLIVPGAGKPVHYAQLTLGSGMVMLGPVQDSAFDKLMVQPDEIGGAETQICYFFVDDAKAHYARARAAGANIVLDIEDEADGGRGYSCRDPEGHIWNFGTFNPWERQSVRGPRGAPKAKRRRGKLRAAAAGVTWLLLVALVAAGTVMYTPALQALAELAHVALAGTTPDAAGVRAEIARERRARDAAERAAREAREQLARERTARADSDQAAATARQQARPRKSQKRPRSAPRKPHASRPSSRGTTSRRPNAALWRHARKSHACRPRRPGGQLPRRQPMS